jgi:hypothetical protein
MGKKITSALVYLIVYIIIAYCFVSNAEAQNQLVPNTNCFLAPDTNKCFSLATQTIMVGKEVTSLGDLYKFCTQILSTVQGQPSRIVLVLDNSSSMCEDERNDPANVRVIAANAFVDSVANHCPACEIGVIVYRAAKATTSAGTIIHELNPLNVGSAANVALIHAMVNFASCSAHSAPKLQDINRLAKTTTTWTGTALDSAVQHMIDLGYDSLVAAGLNRHIILMTDGDWQTPVPADIYTEYITNHPGRPFPTIHGVYLRAVGATGDPYDLTNMQQATQMSTRNTSPNNKPGLFFPGTTPQTIVSAFDTLFTSIISTKTVGLQTVSFTNTTVNPPDSRTATIFLNGGTTNQYTVRVPQFTLGYGANTFIITIQVKDTAGAITTSYDTLTITRTTTSGSGLDTLFRIQCGMDTLPISITCKPLSLQIPAFDSVFAKVVRLQDTSVFLPNDIILRAFVPFPGNDANAIALFHLDNDLVNTASSGAAGVGTPAYSSVNAAFGSALSGGSFTTNLPLPIGASSDFTVECWVKPTQAATIVSGANFKLEITSDNYLSATIGSTQIKTSHVIDLNVWQHVAIARSNGSANLYINGIPMAPAANAIGIISGNLMIGPFSGGMLDEFRISGTVRSSQIQGKTVLQIPLAPQLSWNINGVSTNGQTAALPYTMWQGTPRGQAQFQFSSAQPGPMIINFFDTSSSPLPLMWSKNGDPVLFTTTGLVVSATLRDTSHEGHLDMMDLTWTDISTVKTPLPGVDQFIASLVIQTLDGKWDTLHAATLVLDSANKTLHIILNENNTLVKGNYETGWLDAKIVLTDIKMTADGKSFVVGPIIDGATPIPASACYVPATKNDSLYITFSEPLTRDSSARPENMLRYLQDGKTSQTLQSLNPSIVRTTSDGKMLFVFPFTSTTPSITAYDYSIGEQFSPGPNSPIVSIDYCYSVSLIDTVSATLRDSTHEGHLDMIDLTWTDSISVKTPLPGVDQFIATLVIQTLDGKRDTLHAATLVLDSANKTLHIILRENNTLVKGNYETGWLDAKIVLTNIKLTIDGKPFVFVVGRIIDGATPIPISACYAPAAKNDSLYITFSEPLTRDPSARSENMVRYLQDGKTSQTLQSLNPSIVRTTLDGRMLFVFPFTSTTHSIAAYDYSIGEQFLPGPNSPIVPIDYCYSVSLIDKVRAGPNPFVPNSSDLALINVATPDGKTITTKGIKVEVILKRPAIANNKQVVFGSLMIFDAVGNVILDKAQLLPEVGKIANLAIGWEGKNKKGMIVAGGTYLTRIRVWFVDPNTNHIAQDEIASPPTLIGIKTKK